MSGEDGAATDLPDVSSPQADLPDQDQLPVTAILPVQPDSAVPEVDPVTLPADSLAEPGTAPEDTPVDPQPAVDQPAVDDPAPVTLPVTVAPPLQPFTENAPIATVQAGDHWIILAVAIAALLVLGGFGAVLFASNLVNYPDLAVESASLGYFEDALVYRERRYAVALLLRTFITGFSFVVGLALCTMGGLFILRQVTSLTTLSGNLGANPLQADAAVTVTARRLRETQFAFSSYSPGVVFMLGGVVIMAVTQWLAIPVTALETLPGVVVSSFELNPETGRWDEVRQLRAAGAPLPPDAARATSLPPVPLK